MISVVQTGGYAVIQVVLMASNFSMIPIRCLLTVNSEIAFFFFFNSLAEVVLNACFLSKLIRFKKKILPNW